VPDRPRYSLLIEVGPDPIARHRGIHRSPEYRLKVLLKRLLRDLGLRAVEVRPAHPVHGPDVHRPAVPGQPAGRPVP
jgi:hypothetical protein